MKRREFARATLCAAGFTDPRPVALNVFTAWCYAESGESRNDGTNAAKYNPLNATLVTSGSHSIAFNSVGVGNYFTVGDGIAATSLMLRQGNMSGILQAFATTGETADDVCRAIGNSPWGTGSALLLAVMVDYRKNPSFYDNLLI